MSWESYFDNMPMVNNLQIVDAITLTGLNERGVPSKTLEENQSRSRRMVAAITDTLRHLSVPDLGWCLRESSPRGPAWAQLGGLYTLELTDMSRQRQDALSISRLFQHCSQLRSLTVLGARQRDIDALGAAPTSLPRLESLKLSFYPDHAGWVAWDTQVVPFLREKKRLRRLDFILFRNYIGAEVLQILTAIPNVEILGLPLFEPRSWNADSFKTLDAHLPMNLSVLLLSGVVIDETEAPPRKWVELVSCVAQKGEPQLLIPLFDSWASGRNCDTFISCIPDATLRRISPKTC